MNSTTIHFFDYQAPFGKLFFGISPLGLHTILHKFDQQLTTDFSSVHPQINQYHNSINKELNLYFNGKNVLFSTPLAFSGTSFQKLVWNELLNIPYGKTTTYSTLAEKLERPLGIRAVANAIAKNHINIVVPCHRVIGKNNQLTGYAGGLERKQFLLKLEGSLPTSLF